MRALTFAAAVLLALAGGSPAQAQDSSTKPIVGAWIGEMPIDPDFVTMQMKLDEVPEDESAGKILFCGPSIHCTLDITFLKKEGDSFVFHIHDARQSYCANQEGRTFSVTPNQADEWFFKMEELGGRKVTVRLFRQENDPVCEAGGGFPFDQKPRTTPLRRRLPVFRQP